MRSSFVSPCWHCLPADSACASLSYTITVASTIDGSKNPWAMHTAPNRVCADLTVCCSTGCGYALQAWVEEMAVFMKAIDPNHMVGLGAEGFYSTTCDRYAFWHHVMTLAFRHSAVAAWRLSVHVCKAYLPLHGIQLPCTADECPAEGAWQLSALLGILSWQQSPLTPPQGRLLHRAQAPSAQRSESSSSRSCLAQLHAEIHAQQGLRGCGPLAGST